MSHILILELQSQVNGTCAMFAVVLNMEGGTLSSRVPGSPIVVELQLHQLLSPRFYKVERHDLYVQSIAIYLPHTMTCLRHVSGCGF